MKRIVGLSISITVVLTFIFGIIFTQYRSWYDFYLSYQRVSIEFPQISNDALNVEQLFNDLQAFSDKHQINILQFQFTDELVTDIFASNLRYDEHFKSYWEDKLLQGDSFISTVREPINDSQVGFFNAPWSNIATARVFELSQALNYYGVWSHFMLNGELEHIRLFVNEFSSYGNVVIQDSLEGAIMSGRSVGLGLAMMNSSFLIALITMVVISFCVIFLFSLRYRKQLFLDFLWGKPKRVMLLQLPNKIGKLQLKIMTVCLVLMGVYLIYQQQLSYVLIYLTTFLVLQGFLFLFLTGFSLLCNLLIFKIHHIAEGIKGWGQTPIIVTFISCIKPILTVLLLYLILSSYVDFQILRQELGGFDEWDRAEDVFTAAFNFEAALLFRDREHEIEMESRFKNFYLQVKEENNAFIMSSNNFFHSSPECLPEEFFYFGCHLILVDEAYLRRQAVLTPEGANIVDFIVDDENTLNVFVPIMHQDLESELIEYYLEGFYNQRQMKVHENRVITGEEQVHISKDMLTINLIYKTNNQSYFTYNHHTGDFNSEIKDPIVMLITPSWPASSITDFMTSSLFFVDETNKGLASLEEARATHDLVELRSVTSVYEHGVEYLHQEQARLVRQIVSIVTISNLFIVLQTGFVWTIYQIQSHKLTLQHLFGFPFWNINKKLFTLTLFSYFLLVFIHYLMQNLSEMRQFQIGRFFWFILGTPLHLDFSTSLIVIGIVILFSLELVLIYTIGKRQMKLNTERTLKGDYL